MSSTALSPGHYSREGLLQQPVALLLITGFLIGLKFPLGKISSDAGVSPVVWALLVSLGVCVLLLPVLIIRKRFALPRGRLIRYVVISGLISFVVPNLLLFSVIPQAGAGYTGLMFALSPVFTLTLAVVFKLKTPGRLGVAGIAVGLLGAIIVSVTRSSSPEAPPVLWILAALCIPLALAGGNIYRTIDWSDGASPDVVAFWCHAFAVCVFSGLILFTFDELPLHELALSPWSAVAQMLAAGLMFPVYFRLQQKGGPVLLSQIGYVGAAVGLVAATVFLGEQYQSMTWVGAGVIAAGIAVTIYSQLKSG